MNSIIVGCGDIGRRIALLLRAKQNKDHIYAVVQSNKSFEQCQALSLMCSQIDLAKPIKKTNLPLAGSTLYYLVPPPKKGLIDYHSQHLLHVLAEYRPVKVVLISTTGVYGDCAGDWVAEDYPTNPGADRAKRRLDMETQWKQWAQAHKVPMVILRVPGIYAYDRLPIERLKKGTPVVRASECGFSNRIHADDLSRIAVVAMEQDLPDGSRCEIYNACDGHPSSISEYLQQAALALNLPALPEISLNQARTELSPEMLSYLSESRRISNQKLRTQLGIKLQYPDFQIGIHH